jgi:hypothetical protein
MRSARRGLAIARARFGGDSRRRDRRAMSAAGARSRGTERVASSNAADRLRSETGTDHLPLNGGVAQARTKLERSGGSLGRTTGEAVLSCATWKLMAVRVHQCCSSDTEQRQ